MTYLLGAAARPPKATSPRGLKRRLKNTKRGLNRSARRLSREQDKQSIEAAEAAELARGDELADTVRRAIPWALGAVALGVGFVIFKRRRSAK